VRNPVDFQSPGRPEQWLPVDIHCPACGVTGKVWQQYSAVPATHHDHICAACDKSFSLSAAIEHDTGELMTRRLAALKA
jgi:hypothetical protein